MPDDDASEFVEALRPFAATRCGGCEVCGPNDDSEPCQHERLDEDGICRRCGADRRRG